MDVHDCGSVNTNNTNNMIFYSLLPRVWTMDVHDCGSVNTNNTNNMILYSLLPRVWMDVHDCGECEH